jgi:hypothetical protein
MEKEQDRDEIFQFQGEKKKKRIGHDDFKMESFLGNGIPFLRL